MITVGGEGYVQLASACICLCGLHVSNWPITQSCECEYIPFLLEYNTLIEWYKELKQT
jgi:hypothetical protein